MLPMTTLRAHFDGRVLIPDAPVDLPTDRPLEVHVIPLGEYPSESPEMPGSPAGILAAHRNSLRLTAADVDELERSINDAKLPVKDNGVFDDGQ
ncbi:MAG TPA: hypothetical protein VG269_11255 [Tepidisphaeraceae bacterium]|jgi:hypothetical protein|nr:hypothetical protein [Tepidisphaeraceae bacterium]